jgi:hypothetical protein
MNHSAELKVHQFLSKVRHGDSVLSEEIVDQVTADVRAALIRQFVDKRDNAFSLRMSNVGREYCQLWFDKNEPEDAVPHSTNFVINMMMGDIAEAVFKGLLTQAGVAYDNGDKVKLTAGDHTIYGTPDLTIDGAVDDVKSASPWSYTNKFVDFKTLAENDSFGYVGQLAGYAKAMNVKAGGWWVINKANGEFKYVSAEGIDVDAEVQKIASKADKLKENKFERCYEALPETYRKKETGNLVLGRECGWCSYRYKCWEGLQEMPSLVSKAEIKPMVSYVKIDEVFLANKNKKDNS